MTSQPTSSTLHFPPSTFPSFSPVTSAGKPLRLAMQELLLGGKITPVGARLQVRHTFAHDEKKTLEVVYAFMLPRDATLRRFIMVGPDFSVRSELHPVKEANERYEQGLARGHLASLARLYRDGVTNLSVGNLRPGEAVTVILEILAGVDLTDDAVRFRFPFTLAPTYHRQARVGVTEDGAGEIELPDDQFGDVLLPPFHRDAAALHRVGFDLTVVMPADIAEVGSPSHATRIADLDSRRKRIRLAPDHDLPNRDLVLDVRFKTGFTGVLAARDRAGRCQFAGVLASTAFGKPAASVRRVVFLIDRSGSMSDVPIEQARNACLACVGALGPADQVGMVAFDDKAECFKDRLVTADDTARQELTAFASAIDSRGGTELLEGVRQATAVLGKGGGDIFLITDGQVAGTEDIVKAAQSLGVRIHALGIGSASQDRFLTLIARETGGTSRFVGPRERVDMAALELFRAVGAPVAMDVQTRIEGSDDAVVAPEPATVVFEGRPLVVTGEVRTAGEATLALAWGLPNDRHTAQWPIVPAADQDGGTLRLLRGARLITDAEAQATDVPDTTNRDRRPKRIQALLESLGKEYGLANRYMALVAVVERKGDKAGLLPETHVVPVGIPQDVEAQAYFATAMAKPSARSSIVLCEMPTPYAGPATNDLIAESAPRRSKPRMARGPMADAAPPPSTLDPRPSSDDTDLAMHLCTQIKADGGMPGADDAERICMTLVALLALLQITDHLQAYTFEPQVRRLVDYLKRVDRSKLTTKQNQLINLITEDPHPIQELHSTWIRLAEGMLRRATTVSEAWHAMETLG